MSSVFRRTARLAAVALIAAGLAACGAKQQVPQLGEAQADKFLFDRGTEALAKKSWLSAREYFRRLVDSYPQSQYRAEAKLGIGDSYLGEGRVDNLILGANEFKEFLAYFPTSPRSDYAQYRLTWAASEQMLSAQRDQTATHEALGEAVKFIESYPESKYRPEVEKLYREARDRLSESYFRIGLLYYRSRWMPGAASRFSDIVREDPGYTKRDELFYYYGETLIRLNGQAEALAMFEKILAEFPKSKFRKKAEKRVAELKTTLKR